jgi:hypothetical protein
VSQDIDVMELSGVTNVDVGEKTVVIDHDRIVYTVHFIPAAKPIGVLRVVERSSNLHKSPIDEYS